MFLALVVYFRFDITKSFSFVILRSSSSPYLVVTWFVTVAFSAFLWLGLCNLLSGGSLRISYLLFAVRKQISLSFLFYEKFFFSHAEFVSITGFHV